MTTNEDLLKGAYYYTYNTTSTFDCYNQCIKNPTCDFAQSKNEKDDFFFNCLLYNFPSENDESFDKKFNAQEIFVGNDGELIKISSIGIMSYFFLNKVSVENVLYLIRVN